jgi:hypothetical protein
MSNRQPENMDNVHPKIRKIFKYWTAIHPESGLPGRQHFDPVDVPDLLAHIRLVDVVGEPPRFRVRLCGGRIRDHFGSCQRDRYYDEMFPAFATRPSFRDFMAAIETHAPQLHRGHCELNPEKEFIPLERIVLPLASDGKTVDMLLVVSLFGDDCARTIQLQRARYGIA